MGRVHCLALGDTFLAAQLCNNIFASRSRQHDRDLVFRRLTFAPFAADIHHRAISCIGMTIWITSHQSLLNDDGNYVLAFATADGASAARRVIRHQCKLGSP